MVGVLKGVWGLDVHGSGQGRRWLRLVENGKHVRGLSRRCRWIRVDCYRLTAGTIILMLIENIERLDGAADHDANIITIIIDTRSW